MNNKLFYRFPIETLGNDNEIINFYGFPIETFGNDKGIETLGNDKKNKDYQQ